MESIPSPYAPRFRAAVSRDRLGVVYKLAILLYVLAVVVLSYREGLTIFAKGAGLLLAALFVFRAVSSGEKIFVPREYLLLFAWFLIGVVSSTISRAPGTAFDRVVTLCQVLPLAFIISNFIYWNGDSRFYWLCLVGAALLSGVMTLASPVEFTGIDGRLFGTLGNANAFAALLAVGVAICLGATLGKRTIVTRIVCVALAGFFLYLVARTGSRMGMLASLAAAIAVAGCIQVSGRSRGVIRSTWFLALGAAIVAAMIYFLSSSEFADRLWALTSAAEKGDFAAVGDNSLLGRALLYKKAFELAMENPLLGVGLDVFRTAGIEYRTIGNNSHSNYMEVLASTGIVGFGLYYAIYYSWWSRLVKARNVLKDPFLADRIAIAVAIASVMLVLDVAWVTYYEKLSLLVIAGLIAEVNLVSRAGLAQSSETGRWRGR
ncbi:MAG: O-antigen ligase family protein [Chromatiales bacterium]|nr:O-antigen ligase family protein [Chromatiales bacterium]